MKIKRGMLVNLTNDEKIQSKFNNMIKKLNVSDEIGFFVVNIRNDGLCLVTSVFDYHKHCTIEICDGEKKYYARFKALLPIKRECLAEGKIFNGWYEAVCAIYDAHGGHVKKCFDKKQRQRIMKREQKEMQDSFRRENETRIPIEIPYSVRKNVLHPYQGGGVSPR